MGKTCTDDTEMLVGGSGFADIQKSEHSIDVSDKEYNSKMTQAQ
jgi:hypothetical protein